MTRVFAYCRVSTAELGSELVDQRKAIEEFAAANCLGRIEFIEEVGSGLDFQRYRFLELTRAICRREIRMLIITQRDRLTMFGFSWFEQVATIGGCEIVVIDKEPRGYDEIRSLYHAKCVVRRGHRRRKAEPKTPKTPRCYFLTSICAWKQGDESCDKDAVVYTRGPLRGGYCMEHYVRWQCC